MLGWELGFGRGMMQMPSSAAPGPACDSIPGQGRGGRNETPRRVVWKAKQGALRLCFRHHCPSSGAQSGPQLPGSFKHTQNSFLGGAAHTAGTGCRGPQLSWAWGWYRGVHPWPRCHRYTLVTALGPAAHAHKLRIISQPSPCTIAPFVITDGGSAVEKPRSSRVP